MRLRTANKRRRHLLRRAVLAAVMLRIESIRRTAADAWERMPHRGAIAAKDFSPTPADVNVMSESFQHLWNAFENSETEVSAFWLCQMAQERGHWGSFTRADIERVYRRKYKGFTFNRLINRGTGFGIQRGTYLCGGGWIIEYRGRFFFTEEFVLRCYLSANGKSQELEQRFPWKDEEALNRYY